MKKKSFLINKWIWMARERERDRDRGWQSTQKNENAISNSVNEQ